MTEKTTYWVPQATPAEMLAMLMKENRTTQKQIADVLGCSQANVSHLLNEKQKPTSEQIDQLARFFDVQHNMFFGHKETDQSVHKETNEEIEDN